MQSTLDQFIFSLFAIPKAIPIPIQIPLKILK